MAAGVHPFEVLAKLHIRADFCRIQRGKGEFRPFSVLKFRFDTEPKRAGK
jgi:hypothetical protein